MQAIKLRPYQEKAVAELRAGYARLKRAMLFVLPTGGGKTFTFCFVAMGAAAKGNRVVILVHRKRLLKQAAKSLAAMGIPHGIIAPGYQQNGELIQVASIQTLIGRVRKDPQRYRFDLLIPDEAHHATSPTFKELFALMPDAKLLGVTATPQRTDGQGLGAHAGGVFDGMVVGPSMRELIDMGMLVEPIVYAPPGQADMTGARSTAGDFNQADAEERVNKPTITGSAVEHYRKLCDGQPAVAFCVSVKHAEAVAADFRAAGYRAASIDGSMDEDECERLIAALASGELQVLTSCDMISEGFDLPAIACAILLRPTQSVIRYLQEVGRALRPSGDKACAIVLDHVGNVLRHGFPDDDRDWSLDGRKKKKRKLGDNDEDKPPAVRQCETCSHSFKPPLAVCPRCGAPYETKAREIKELDGELERFDAAKLADARRKKALKAEIAQADSLDALMQIGAREGYKGGWAYKRWHLRKQRRAA